MANVEDYILAEAPKTVEQPAQVKFVPGTPAKMIMPISPVTPEPEMEPAALG